MKINSISSVSHQGNQVENAKKMALRLKDGKSFKLTVGDDFYQALITDGKNVVEGRGMQGKGFAEDLGQVVKNIRPSIKQGFDFIEEFVKSVMK